MQIGKNNIYTCEKRYEDAKGLKTFFKEILRKWRAFQHAWK